jgi:PncC family amidohydrolase
MNVTMNLPMNVPMRDADVPLTVAAAESLTGGMICSAIVGRSGASAYFRGGVVVYSLDAKVQQLGVDRKTAEGCDCVSKAVAAQMAVGVSSLFGCEVGISTTGYAETCPADGSDGIVRPQQAFVGLHDTSNGQTIVRHITVDTEMGAPASRNDFRRRVTHLALSMLHEYAAVPMT